MGGGIAIDGLRKQFGDVLALAGFDARIAPGRLTGLVGPDGAGKTTLMRIMAGLMAPTDGKVTVAGHDAVRDTTAIHAITGYMPQRFGLYEDLSVAENLHLYANLKNVAADEREGTFARLLDFTRLAPFTSRLAGRLSGGMKQKLGLACALMARPRVLLLDEPSVGVDPLSRRELWEMVRALAGEGMTVVWSTAYLDEAEQCEHVLLLNEGRLEFHGAPSELTGTIAGRSFRLVDTAGDRRALLIDVLDLPGTRDAVIQGEAVRAVLDAATSPTALEDLAASHGGRVASAPPRFEDAFIDLLGGGPGGRSALAERMDPVELDAGVAVSCSDLTKRYGEFVAADRVTFDVRRGEVFGLLGPNGAGKSTTFKMLCGLVEPSAGQARVVGFDLRHAASEAKSQLGYMAQKFSLYGLLSVRQNLEFFSGVYSLSGRVRRRRIEEMIETFDLARFLHAAPDSLPLGYKQRLALACALMHRPPVLFLDEPTSGVDPLTRREFWMHINGLVRKGVTVLVTTHFMDEAEYCDRVALMYRARVIALAPPDELKRRSATADRPDPSMEDAFIHLVESADLDPPEARAA